MRILHVVPTYLPAWRYGGTIQSVHGICKALVRRGHDVHVYTTNVDGPDNLNVELAVPTDLEGVKVWYFPTRFIRRIYMSPDMRSALISSINNFDIAHLQSVFLWPTWMGARIAETHGLPYIVSPRGMFVEDLINRKNKIIKKLWISCIENRTLKKASAIHVTSNLEQIEVKKLGLDRAPIYVIPNGVESENGPIDGPAIEPCLDQLNTNQPFILYLGRINWKKGLDRLISALRFVPEVRLVIAGNDEEDYTRYLMKIARECHVYDRVVFYGPVYDSRKRYLYRSSSIFVLPSYSENFGNTVLEAMAAGSPVVVTPEVGLADTVLEAGAGLVVDGNPESLGRNLRDLIANEPLRRKMGEAGLKVVKERFSWDTVAQEMQRVYEAVLMER